LKILTAKFAKKNPAKLAKTAMVLSALSENPVHFAFKKLIMTENEISNKVIGLAIEVHCVLGPGLYESAYKECLFYRLIKSGMLLKKKSQFL
jgi:hypothetical protein